jgi:hypothetical protein
MHARVRVCAHHVCTVAGVAGAAAWAAPTSAVQRAIAAAATQAAPSKPAPAATAATATTTTASATSAAVANGKMGPPEGWVFRSPPPATSPHHSPGKAAPLAPTAVPQTLAQPTQQLPHATGKTAGAHKASPLNTTESYVISDYASSEGEDK